MDEANETNKSKRERGRQSDREAARKTMRRKTPA
jgi:hypothetical protein